MATRITLTTDFGTRDAYVAELKAALLSELEALAQGTPFAAQILDLSHELVPFDVRAAAWFVRAALPRFPRGTVHLVVVDPGVGSARRPLVARAAGQILVGPDNGIFGHLFAGDEEVFAADPAVLGARALSHTFHGRDLFAPLAARLAAGARCEELGARVEDYQRIQIPAPISSEDGLSGEILHVDHYGNLVSNLTPRAVGEIGAKDALVFQIRGHEIEGLRDHYAQVEPAQPLAVVGSAGLIELSVREGSAAARFAAERGDTLRVSTRRDRTAAAPLAKRG